MWLARVFGICINNVDMEPPRPTRAPSVLLGREKEVEGGRSRSAKSRTSQATRVLYLSPLNLAPRTRNATPRKLGNGGANSVDDLIIVDLSRYQAEH
jgi:hypothetical protein